MPTSDTLRKLRIGRLYKTDGKHGSKKIPVFEIRDALGRINPRGVSDPEFGTEPSPANHPDRTQQADPQRITFEKMGTINLLGNEMAVYVAVGQSVKYRDAVWDNIESAVDKINLAGEEGRLSDEDRAVLSGVKAIAATGEGVQRGFRFGAVGVDGVSPNLVQSSSGMSTSTGVWFTNEYVADVSTGPQNSSYAAILASTIGHEAKHSADRANGLFQWSNSPLTEALGVEWNRGQAERSADYFQLRLYEKVVPDPRQRSTTFMKHLERDMTIPHLR